jgi:hypothetical protein
MAWTLHRIIRQGQPTLLDMTSNAAQGLGVRSTDPAVLRLWDGISCWATEAQARRALRSFPSLGTHIAVLHIPDEAPVRVERTRGPGHFTVWAALADLLSYVIAVSPA